MTSFGSERFCDGCGVEITWAPYYVNPVSLLPGQRRGEYCCQTCADGLRCKCGERMVLEDERRQPQSLSEIGI